MKQEKEMGSLVKIKVDSMSYDHIDVKTEHWFDGHVQHMTNEIVRLKDKAVRDALVALGWTPPKGVYDE